MRNSSISLWTKIRLDIANASDLESTGIVIRNVPNPIL